MEQELCTTCETPLSWMPVNEKYTCSNGLRCYRLLKKFSERLLYQSEIAIYPTSNLDIAEHMLDFQEIRDLKDFYTFDYSELVKNEVITEEEYTHIVNAILRVLKETTFASFIKAMNIPLIDFENGKASKSLATIVNHDTVNEIDLALGYLLTSWETNYGKHIEEDDNPKNTEMTLYKLLPFGTKAQIHGLARLFTPSWVK